MNCWLRVLLLVWLAVYGTAAHAAGPHRFENEIAAFEAGDKTNPPPQHAILFLGSSSIRKWTTLARDFPNHRVFNRGFGGSQLDDSVYFFDRIVAPYKPKMIVLYAGSNDINAGKTPQRVFDDFKTFVGKVHAELPARLLPTSPSTPAHHAGRTWQR